MKKIMGRVIFTLLEFVSLMSIILLFFCADSDPREVWKIALTFAAVAVVSGVLAYIMDDPNKIKRHLSSLLVFFLAWYGSVFKTNSSRVRTAYIQKLRCGTYRNFYKKCLKSYDIMTYDEPTSKYFYGSDGPKYNKIVYEDDYMKMKNKRRVINFYDFRKGFR